MTFEHIMKHQTGVTYKIMMDNKKLTELLKPKLANFCCMEQKYFKGEGVST